MYNGQRFTGTQRRNYIPNSEKGRLLLGLLKIARRKPNKTTFDLINGIKFELLLNKNIEALHGYRYRTFKVFSTCPVD